MKASVHFLLCSRLALKIIHGECDDGTRSWHLGQHKEETVCTMYAVREFRKLTFLFKAGWLAIAAVISRDVTE